MKQSYQWFTIVELLGAIIIISIALLSILSLLRVAVTYTNKTRQETIAINLAREGMEWVYTRRNTNWLRQSGEKDKNRLNRDNQTGSNAQRLKWWLSLYRLSTSTTTYGKVPIFASGWTLPNLNNSIIWNPWLLLAPVDFIWEVSPDAAGKFYRAIVGIGLYLKNSNTPWGTLITCENWLGSYWGQDCGDNTPKEYRFCSKVEYQKNEQQWKVELCGSITNYQE